MAAFGSFALLCKSVPSYPWCNLFHNQITHWNSTALTLASSGPDSPVGVNQECGITRAVNGSFGNLGNMIACGLSILTVANLIFMASRRKAAVARIEFRAFLILYLLTLPFQLLSTGSVLAQDSLSLVVITSIHAGLVAALFWTLLANGLIATQLVEDGTISSLLPFYGLGVAFFVATTYISLDVALTITRTFGPSDPLLDLNSIPLFVLTSVWPAFASVVWFVLMIYVIVGILRESRPLFYVGGAAILFAVSQVIYFLISKMICNAAGGKLDGSFIATTLETIVVGLVYTTWRSITEDNWDNEWYPS